MPKSHDHDAGGDPEILVHQATLRERTRDRLAASGARFPGAHQRIPNFTGAEAAAERLRATDPWSTAETVEANPDSPQWPVRQRALEDGETVFMAVARLAEERPILLLDPDHLRRPLYPSGSASTGSSVGGSTGGVGRSMTPACGSPWS